MRHLSLAAQVWIGLVLCAGAASWLLAVPSPGDAALAAEVGAPVVWVLLIAAAAAHAFPVIAPKHQAYHATPAFLIAAVLLLSWPAVALLVVAIHVTEWLRRRRPWYIQLYNVAVYLLACGAAALILNRLHIPPFSLADARAIGAALLAAAVFLGVNHGLTALVLLLARGVSPRQSGLFGRESLAIDGALLLVGIGMAGAWVLQPVAALFGAAPLALMYRGLRMADVEVVSHRDSLTGLYNARHFSESLELEQRRARHSGRHASVMVINVDDVPRIVHRFGPATLDFLMAAVAERVIPTLRDYDVVARIAEGRLGVLLPDTEVADADALAATVRAAVEERPFGLPTAREPVSASVSAAVSPLPVARPADEVVEQAERTAARAPLAAAAEWSLPRTSLPVLEAAVIVPGLIATALAIVFAPVPDVVLVGAVVVLVGLSEALAFELYDRTSFSISFTPILAAGLLGGPTATLVATWGVALLRGTVRRTRVDKVLFNGAVFSLFGLAADLIASGGGTWAIRANNLPVLVVATLAASAAYYVHTFVVATAVAVDLSADPRRVWERNFRWLFPHYLVLGAMGLGLAVATIELGPLGSILFLAPPLMMRFVLKQYTDRTSATVTRLQSTNAELVSTSALLQRRGDELALLSDLGQLAASEARASNLLSQVVARCVPALGDGCAVAWRSSSNVERAFAGSLPEAVLAMNAEQLLAFGATTAAAEQHQGWDVAPLPGAEAALGWLVAWTGDRAPDESRAALMGEVARRLALVLERDALLEEAATVDALRAVDRAKSDFIATTAHELRTPLTSLQGYTELLRNDVEPALRERWLRILHVEAAQLGQVVDQLLDVSRLDSGRFGAERCAFSIPELIAAVLGTFAEQAALSGHSLHCSLSADLPLAFGDPAHVQRVLRNLVSNALKYSPEGGTIRACAFERAPGELELVVEDQGMGIPAAWLPRLFERFQRIEEPDRASIRGTGLGLYIARQLVERNGGQIWAASAGAHQGASFHFTIPAARSETE